MPEFVDIASHFDDVSVYDGYTGVLLFLAQFNSFDESSPDGNVAKKRSMSTRPGIAMPTRRVIQFVGERWIVGDGNTDAFQDEAVRSVYSMKKITELGVILTPAQACAGAAGTSTYLHRAYLKDVVNGASDSEYDPFWNIFTAPSEVVDKGYFFRTGGRLYRVRATPHLELNGLILSASDELDDGSEVAVTVTGSVYDPGTDTYSGADVVTTGLMFDAYKLYKLDTSADPKIHSGDMTLMLANTVTIAVGSRVTIGGARWQVISKNVDHDAWVLHVRRQ